MNITNQELLELSTKIEREGKDFYTALAEKVSDREVKDLLLLLAKEENLHENQFKKLLDKKGDQSFGWENSDPLREIINQNHQTDIFPTVESIFEHLSEFDGIQKSLDYALEVEKTNAEFYGLMQEACSDYETKTLLVLLEQAEREHIDRLESLKKKYQAA